ncbi:MAG TPA: hypothetical protein VD963_11465 [Phycisphaerales bacterium]|nr:hypothetical protein [Phycisphaerales bacterium]
MEASPATPGEEIPPASPAAGGASPCALPRTLTALPARVVCVRCGYLLRGLSPAAHCPECGLDIATSLEPVRLHAENPRPTRRVRAGAILLALGGIGAALLAVATTAASLSGTSELVGVILVIVGWAVLPALTLGGTLLVTTPIAWPDVARAERARKRARALTLLGTLLLPVGALIIFVGLELGPPWLHLVTVAAALLAWTGALTAVLGLVRHAGSRLGTSRVTSPCRAARTLLWLAQGGVLAATVLALLPADGLMEALERIGHYLRIMLGALLALGAAGVFIAVACWRLARSSRAAGRVASELETGTSEAGSVPLWGTASRAPWRAADRAPPAG